MIQIAVCDDAPEELVRLGELIGRMSPFEGQYEISTFPDGKSLLNSERRPFDLLILDVQMPDMDGCETARRLRADDTGTVLVFLTGTAAPTVEVFQVTPFRYLMKQMDETAMQKELQAAFDEVNRKMQFVTFRTEAGMTRLKTSSILYLTIAGRKVEIVSDQGRISVRGKISELYETLAPHGFSYSHKSYLVNFNRVLTISGHTVIMENGDILPISQPKAKSFREEFVRFAGMLL